MSLNTNEDKQAPADRAGKTIDSYLRDYRFGSISNSL